MFYCDKFYIGVFLLFSMKRALVFVFVLALIMFSSVGFVYGYIPDFSEYTSDTRCSCEESGARDGRESLWQMDCQGSVYTKPFTLERSLRGFGVYDEDFKNVLFALSPYNEYGCCNSQFYIASEGFDCNPWASTPLIYCDDPYGQAFDSDSDGVVDSCCPSSGELYTNKAGNTRCCNYKRRMVSGYLKGGVFDSDGDGVMESCCANRYICEVEDEGINRETCQGFYSQPHPAGCVKLSGLPGQADTIWDFAKLSPGSVGKNISYYDGKCASVALFENGHIDLEWFYSDANPGSRVPPKIISQITVVPCPEQKPCKNDEVKLPWPPWLGSEEGYGWGNRLWFSESPVELRSFFLGYDELSALDCDEFYETEAAEMEFIDSKNFDLVPSGSKVNLVPKSGEGSENQASYFTGNVVLDNEEGSFFGRIFSYFKGWITGKAVEDSDLPIMEPVNYVIEGGEKIVLTWQELTEKICVGEDGAVAEDCENKVEKLKSDLKKGLDKISDFKINVATFSSIYEERLEDSSIELCVKIRDLGKIDNGRLNSQWFEYELPEGFDKKMTKECFEEDDDYPGCAKACREFMPQNVRDLLDEEQIEESEIRGYCSGDDDRGLNFDFSGSDDEGRKNYFYVLSLKEDEFFNNYHELWEDLRDYAWNPQRDIDGVDTSEDSEESGEGECKERWEPTGGGVKEDCICYVKTNFDCEDEDLDGYGAENTFRESCDYGSKPDCFDDPAEDYEFGDSSSMREIRILSEAGENVYSRQSGLAKTFREWISKKDYTFDEEWQKRKGYVGDNVNPSKENEESYNLYDPRVYFGVPGSFMDFGVEVSACTDGLDNDCDGKFDCEDVGCGESPSCEGTCAAGCFEVEVEEEEKEKVVDSDCFDRESVFTNGVLDEEKAANLMGEGVRFEVLESSEEIKDCSEAENKKCICKIDLVPLDCSVECVDKREELDSLSNDEVKLYGDDCREARDDEEKGNNRLDNRCYSSKNHNGFTVFDYMFFHEPEKYEEGCCCQLCYIKAASFEKKELSDGQKIINALDNLFKVSDGVKAEVLKKAREGTLFTPEDGKLYEQDRIIGKVKAGLGEFICDDSLNILEEKDLSGDEPKYGLYALAVMTIFKAQGITRDAQDYVIGVGKKVPRAELVDNDYGDAWNEVNSRSSLMVGFIASYSNQVPAKECKMCPSRERLDVMYFSSGSSYSSSYFVLSDNINESKFLEGSVFSGKAYSIEPHGIQFDNPYFFEDKGNGLIYKFDKDDFERCEVNSISDSEEFVVGNDFETVIERDNFTLTYPVGVYSENLSMTITDVGFVCNLDSLRGLPEDFSLKSILIETKKSLWNEISLSYIRMVLRFWRDRSIF